VVSLLTTFTVEVAGQPVHLQTRAQQLIAYLALRDAPVDRALVRGELWSDVGDRRAAGALRTTMWRLESHLPDLIVRSGSAICLAPDVVVDLRLAQDEARKLLDDNATLTHRSDAELSRLIERLDTDLLPGWYDNWIVIPQDRWKQLRLHALEALSDRARKRGRFVVAHDAALVALSIESLREGPHRCAIQAHLDEGNQSEALRHYESYVRLLHDELAVAPSLLLDDLIRTARPA